MLSAIRKAVACTAIVSFAATASVRAADDLKIWFDKPAAPWEEALPLGSGRLGAMVFGGYRYDNDGRTETNTALERIQFNEDTLWTGKPHDYVRPNAVDALPEIRQLIFDGKSEDAAKVVRAKFLSSPVRQKAYQPFGDLRMLFPGHENAANYRRELDLDSAVATVSYDVNGVTHRRETFATNPGGAIVTRISAAQPGKVSATFWLDAIHPNRGVHRVDDNTIALFGQVTDHAKEPIPASEGMKFESRLRVLNEGGTVRVTDRGAVEVSGADSVTLVLVAATNFVNYRDVSADPAARCGEHLLKLKGRPYEALKAEHIADHQRLFRRMKVDFGTSEAAKLPTDVRLKRVADGVKAYENALSAQKIAATQPSAAKVDVPDPAAGLMADPSFAALYFQMGRYMLIASSRPGDEPANLQGVWNELRDPPWESKFTTNINFEMNYWPAEVANLAELHEPMFDMVRDLQESGAVTAKKQYGVDKGWVLHHNTDHWRGTAPINNIDGMWPTGGAWVAYHLWEHYLFNGDKKFLQQRAYPALKGASEFFVGFLIPDPKDGLLVTNPSHSPEQGPLNAGPAMDMQLIRACFDATIEASETLGVDHAFASKLRETRAKLVPDQVGKHGQLQEWKDDLDVPNNNHRHPSPLWGLYPGSQFTPENKEIFEAAKVLLTWRGDGSTGWSYAWRIPLWARVYDGDFAMRQLYLQLAKRTFPNLFDKCGPFQVDGNFGATGGLVELVLQSHRRVPGTKTPIIHLLPAVPTVWKDRGSMTGLRARGGFECDIAWANGKLTNATLRSTIGGKVRLQLGDKSFDLDTKPGQAYTINPELQVASR